MNDCPSEVPDHLWSERIEFPQHCQGRLAGQLGVAAWQDQSAELVLNALRDNHFCPLGATVFFLNRTSGIYDFDSTGWFLSEKSGLRWDELVDLAVKECKEYIAAYPKGTRDLVFEIVWCSEDYFKKLPTD